MLVEARVCFTVREQEILVRLAQGLSSKEIARDLSLKPRTVECHIERLRIKTGVRNRLQLMVAAIRAGVVDAVPTREAHDVRTPMLGR
ncbi:response regulator transcription factor [Sphingomonas sp. S2-65]|uniref:response regulator transcription factor n=1 Tax=Sphingomonas sp. S2-65 TaxID=2903960 RepID=UPI001F33D992|nr:helix-turn-helix transcriptional regulator [Sphingomonas sp. S2-65]UYY57090.1 helix-turn-helix transcriptional regulator [Sphingomonas sp. S2-65]